MSLGRYGADDDPMVRAVGTIVGAEDPKLKPGEGTGGLMAGPPEPYVAYLNRVWHTLTGPSDRAGISRVAVRCLDPPRNGGGPLSGLHHGLDETFLHDFANPVFRHAHLESPENSAAHGGLGLRQLVPSPRRAAPPAPDRTRPRNRAGWPKLASRARATRASRRWPSSELCARLLSVREKGSSF